MFEPEVFQEQMCCIEVLVKLLFFFALCSDSSPPSDSAPRNLYPLAPLVNPLYVCYVLTKVLLFHRVPTRLRKYEKTLIFKIGFQDLEKVLNLAKMHVQ